MLRSRCVFALIAMLCLAGSTLEVGLAGLARASARTAKLPGR